MSAGLSPEFQEKVAGEKSDASMLFASLPMVSGGVEAVGWLSDRANSKCSASKEVELEVNS
jgi:hypothetical protein